jgi:uncharacterized OB-fold protein
VSRPRPLGTDEPLRLKRQITLHYRFAAGRFATPFFRALRGEGRVLATVDADGNALLPPRPVSGLTNSATTGWVEVGPTATLSGYTVVHVPFIDPMTGERRPVPYGFGLVRFDGASTNVYHLIDETDQTKLRVGLALEPVFKPAAERQGNLADIRFFRVRDGAAPAQARPIPPPEQGEPLVYEQKIDLPYVYTAGAAQRAFLRGLAEGRIVASVDDEGRRYVPARSHAPDGRPLTRTEEVPPAGEIVALTRASHLPGAPAFAMIRVGGSATPFVHRLGGGAEDLGPGDRVEAVFAPDPEEPSVTAISHFRPAP